MKKINVYGKIYTIEYVDEVEDNEDGMIYKKEGLIHIAKSLKGDDRTSTEWHEITHALIYRLGHEENISDDAIELICEHFAVFLTEQGCKLK